MIAEALRESRDRRRRKGISLSARVDPDLPRISADPLRLRAVFDNILSNALKYTPDGGSITVESRVGCARDTLDGRETVSISITDTGPGIPAAFRSRIFDKFFRLEHHQTDGSPGGAWSRHRPVHVPADRRAAWRRHRVRFGPDDRGTCITVTLPSTVQRGHRRR